MFRKVAAPKRDAERPQRCSAREVQVPAGRHQTNAGKDHTYLLFEEAQVEIHFHSQTQFSCIQKLGGKINAEQKMCNYDEVLALTVEFLKVLDDTMDRPHQVWCMQKTGIRKAPWEARAFIPSWSY